VESVLCNDGVVPTSKRDHHAAAQVAGMIDEKTIGRFKLEVSLSRQFGHPNVIRMYDLGSYGETKYMTMELLEGEDLGSLMREGPLPLEQGIDLLIQACTALQIVHDHGVVHRDVKPDNFFLTKAGVLKVMDFAIAKRQKTSSGLTRTNVPAGTPQYLAPEQASAQRIGKVFASVTTWAKLVRARGWRRPRRRLHPPKPTVGLRATQPNEAWHVDTTIVRLLDGTRAYLHAVIDNFSRKILAWTVAARLEPTTTCQVLFAAGKHLVSAGRPLLCADSGIENVNAAVDDTLLTACLDRVLAQVDVIFSNSMIEAFWRSLKHQWLYLNSLDSIERLRALVEFYVEQHNTQMPQAAFPGQTPDEMYFGTAANLPAELAAARSHARVARLAANRAMSCDRCLGQQPDPTESRSGRTMARTGLRMMPTFPSSPLRFRTAGFPQYGSKAGFPSAPFLRTRRLSRLPACPVRVRVCFRRSRPPWPHRTLDQSRGSRLGMTPPCERHPPLYPRGPRSGPGCSVPVHQRLTGPIRPTRRHVALSRQCRLCATPSLCGSA
jgi:transposase InsO family protein